MRCDAPHTAKDIRDVGAEDASEGVHLVDHDEGKVLEEQRPAVVRRQDPDVEHVGVGHDDVGCAARPRALGRRRVAVVDGRARGRERESPELAQLVLGERLRWEQVQRRRARLVEQPLERP